MTNVKPRPDAMGIRPKLIQIREIEKTQGPAAAERALVAMLRDGEQSHMAFLALARVLLKQQKYEDAVRAATKAKSLAPLEANGSILLGLIGLRTKDIDQAAEAFADAIRLDPYSTRAHLGAADRPRGDPRHSCEPQPPHDASGDRRVRGGDRGPAGIMTGSRPSFL